MDAIPDILDDLRAGKMVVLVDDEQRENEGDLVIAAGHATPEAVNFMLREARGMMCVALGPGVCDRLRLEPQGRENTSQRSTAYTITVDAHERFGITTGVSAADRAATIRKLADPAAGPGDLARPGHVQPLRAREGGALVRAGQTEGSVDLCRLAGLQPAAVIIEVMNDDGTMARRPQLETLCAKRGIKMCSVADVIHYRLQRQKLIERIDEMPFANEVGSFRLIAYRSVVDPFPHVALVCGDIGALDPTGLPVEHDRPALVRMHRQNLLGDVFGDLTQPSGKTLARAMAMIHREGRGAVVYLRHEGMGTGLLKRLQTAAAPASASSTAGEARAETPPPMHTQSYGIGSQILRDLGIRRLRLITDHPHTPAALSGFGLSISAFVPTADQ